MVADRRIPEASGLRQLFHEQWAHLVRLFEDWDSRRADAREKDATVSEAIETVVSGTDARIRGVRSYQKRLRDSVRSVLEHVEELVDGLPGAIAVNQKTFSTDPLVNAFFVNKEEVKKIFSRSRELQEFFSADESSGLEQAYAILFVTKKEKTILGISMKANILMRDVQQTTVSFTGHRIFSPCPTEEAATNLLKETLFNSVVEYVRACMTRLQNEAAEKAGRDKSPASRNNLKNPETYLEELTSKLSAPRDLLRLHRNTLRVSKIGIKITGEMSAAANEVHLDEVDVGELPTRIITIIKYPRDEMLSPDELMREYSRYL